MNDLWLWLLLLLCLGMALQGLRRPERIYEPLLPMATIFFGFVWLQLHGFWLNETRLPQGALAKTLFMSILCAAGFWFGYSWKVKPLRLLSGEFNQGRLFLVSLALSLLGASFFFLLSRLPEEMLARSQWTGLPVLYLFFASTLSYGFALACLLWARYSHCPSLWVALFGGIFYLDRIVIAGRRAVTAEFFFIIVLALFWGRKKLLPRWAMVGVMLFMVLALHSTGHYRSLAREARWDAPILASTIDFFANVEHVFLNGGEELKNAIYMIEAYDYSDKFDYGLVHWNQLVFNYVPAQLVGADVKSSLMVKSTDVAKDKFSYETSTGSTQTGMVDSFGSFWYLGAMKFFLVGLILRKIWRGAELGHLGAQLLYMLLVTKALHIVTHHTHWFIFPWIHMVFFLFPLLLWARQRKPLPPLDGSSPQVLRQPS